MFKKIDSSDSGSNLPFFDAWVKDLTPSELKHYDGYEEVASKIKEAISGKGFTIFFEHFMVFVWRKSSQGKAIAKLFEETEGYAFGIALESRKKTLGYELGFFDDQPMFICLNVPEEDTIEFMTPKAKEKLDKAREAVSRNKKSLEQGREELLAKVDSINKK